LWKLELHMLMIVRAAALPSLIGSVFHARDGESVCNGLTIARSAPTGISPSYLRLYRRGLLACAAVPAGGQGKDKTVKYIIPILLLISSVTLGQTGTASIAGTVVDSKTLKPVPRRACDR
jgi:hypothetical protein